MTAPEANFVRLPPRGRSALRAAGRALGSAPGANFVLLPPRGSSAARLRGWLGWLVLAVAALAPAGGAWAQQGDLIDVVRKRGALQVGFSSFLPWAMRDKEGRWVGFEIDVATKLAHDLGVAFEPVPTAFDGIVPALVAGKFDIIIGGLIATPARREQVDFSDPYSVQGLGIAASKALASGLRFPEGYNDAGVTLVCRRGTAACKTIEEKWPKATIRQFDDDAVAFQEVINGSAHAVLSNEPKPTFFTLQNPEKLFRPTTEFITSTRASFAVRKGNPAMLAYCNEWIARNGAWLQQRDAYWFKGREWAASVPGG